MPYADVRPVACLYLAAIKSAGKPAAGRPSVDDAGMMPHLAACVTFAPMWSASPSSFRGNRHQPTRNAAAANGADAGDVSIIERILSFCTCPIKSAADNVDFAIMEAFLASHKASCLASEAESLMASNLASLGSHLHQHSIPHLDVFQTFNVVAPYPSHFPAATSLPLPSEPLPLINSQLTYMAFNPFLFTRASHTTTFDVILVLQMPPSSLTLFWLLVAPSVNPFVLIFHTLANKLSTSMQKFIVQLISTITLVVLI
ncbi:hypothetical protein L7F22_027572 [Adiantum nelumboides]|nr:hypothetical protein [Adiantum nelumboides]